jgi:hypothetical protein
MRPEEAEAELGAFLAPMTAATFLDEALQGGFRVIAHDGDPVRLRLLGGEPAAALAGAHHLADRLTYHSANATGPAPSLAGVTDAADFRGRIEAFHARNYSVRFPDLRPLCPQLERVCRAIEALLHQPVTASAFWSRGGMRAPVHYDDHDLIVLQLHGSKRWFVTETPSILPNPWKQPGAPELGPHRVVDLSPGDRLYLPRGTAHTVDSTEESLHLAIGFTPLTLREAVMAALDQLSDLEAPLRMTVGGRLAPMLRGRGAEPLAAPVAEATARLAAAVRAPGFVDAALQRRSARAVAALAALPRPQAVPALSLDTVLGQAEGAVCHLTREGDSIDFAYPGGRLAIHRGALAAVVFVAGQARFAVRDLPGEIGDDVRLALCARFVEVGFLEVG